MIKKNKKLNKIIFIICVIIFCISSYFIIQEYIENNKSKINNEKLISEVINVETNSGEIAIDWDKLKAINEDIVGWIRIDNTNIDYPILKSKDDLYYLTHSFNKEKNKNGSIFITNENINLFEDSEITIYGHHMRNGMMFASLQNYMSKDFFKEHKSIHIYTPDSNYEGIVFSVFSKNVFEVENEIKMLNLEERIEYYKNNSIYQNEKEESQKIVKLITCSYINAKTAPTEERYYIISYLKT